MRAWGDRDGSRIGIARKMYALPRTGTFRGGESQASRALGGFGAVSVGRSFRERVESGSVGKGRTRLSQAAGARGRRGGLRVWHRRPRIRGV